MSKRLPRAIAAIAAIALASFSIGVARADISEVRISHGFGVFKNKRDQRGGVV